MKKPHVLTCACSSRGSSLRRRAARYNEKPVKRNALPSFHASEGTNRVGEEEAKPLFLSTNPTAMRKKGRQEFRAALMTGEMRCDPSDLKQSKKLMPMRQNLL